MTNKITKTEITNSDIRVTLADGVTVDIAFHQGRIHLHFSGLDEGPGLVAGAFIGQPNIPTVQCANYVDVGYNPRKER